MRKLLNTLYINTPDVFLTLENEDIVIKKEDHPPTKIPLLNLENIVCFSYSGASFALMGKCAEKQIGFCFLSPHGRFLGRVTGEIRGNVLLRKKQYSLSEEQNDSVKIASSFLIGKLYNSRKVLGRAIRDHGLIINKEKIGNASHFLKEKLNSIQGCQENEQLMGIEGIAAQQYFDVFDELILQQKNDFYFRGRSKRPPLDNVNAMLSFLYTVLAHETANALETVGLDPYVGFLHQDRPGRPSLALDLMEEFRSIFCDRLVLSLINRKQITGSGFCQKESGGILMDEETRKKVLMAWQERKKEEIIHPFLKEKIEFGLLPFVQALLLARYLRGDLDAYPPFFWD